jgi:hypothetical protein
VVNIYLEWWRVEDEGGGVSTAKLNLATEYSTRRYSDASVVYGLGRSSGSGNLIIPLEM